MSVLHNRLAAWEGDMTGKRKTWRKDALDSSPRRWTELSELAWIWNPILGIDNQICRPSCSQHSIIKKAST